MRALEHPQKTGEIELLLQHGARPDLLTADGKSALDIVDLKRDRQRAANNQGLQLLKQRGFKIRLLPPTPAQIERDKMNREMYEAGLIARP